ncbi:MAG: hypothetical protein AAF728_08785 [Cyanobacteria bacterium P01_D01_bin.128]
MTTSIGDAVSAAPESGQNTIFVGHDDTFEVAIGIYPAPQSLSYMLTPTAMAALNW